MTFVEEGRSSIEGARQGRTHLILAHAGLRVIPAEIGELTTLTHLDLQGNSLTELPPEIGKLTALRRLNLRSNKLVELPPEIGNLTALNRLYLSRNQLTALPAKIGNLTALTQLDLRQNQLTLLPAEIGNLTALPALDLSLNQLTALPAEIGRLTTLTRLDLSHNHLTALPAEIGNLTNLTDLRLGGGEPALFGYTPRNRLTELPPEIGKLTALTTLDLSKNELTALPAEIGDLPALTGLGLASNQLTYLPPEIGKLTALTTLDLSKNELTALPAEIGDLPALTGLGLASNQLTCLPPEIGKLTTIAKLDLRHNRLKALPKTIASLPPTVDLECRGNPLQDPPYSVIVGGTRMIRRYFLLQRRPGYRIVWRDDAASRALGFYSGFAILQTILVVVAGLAVTGIGIYLPLLWSVFLAPFLLMRTESSTEHALRRQAKLIRRLRLFSQQRDKVQLFLALRLVVVGIGSIWIRLYVAFNHMLRRPKQALEAVPGNFWHHLCQTGVFAPPELIPGAERGVTGGGDEVLATYDLWRDLRWSRLDPRGGRSFDLTRTAILSLGLFYLVAFCWRLGLRFAGLVYWPFLVFQPDRIDSQHRTGEAQSRGALWWGNPTCYLQLSLLGLAISLLGLNVPLHMVVGTALGDALGRGAMVGPHLRLDPSLGVSVGSCLLSLQALVWLVSNTILDYQLTLEPHERTKGMTNTYQSFRIIQNVLLTGVSICMLIIVSPFIVAGLDRLSAIFLWPFE